MIEIECGACGQGMQADEDMAGRRVKCPKCGSPRMVPDDRAGPRINPWWVVWRVFLVITLLGSAAASIGGDPKVPNEWPPICFAVALLGLATTTPRLRD